MKANTKRTSPQRPKSLTGQVAEQLRKNIINGTIELGSHLSEARIAEEMGVSRTPVREAINRLEMDGLVVIEPQRGTRVFSLESVDLEKICDTRMYLEMAGFTEACKQDPDALEQSLSQCVKDMKAAITDHDLGRYLELDTQFHQYFFDHSNNQYLVDAYKTISIKMAALRTRLIRHVDHLERSLKEHVQIVESISAGNIDAARDELIRNIGRAPGTYWNLIAGQSQI